MKTYKTINFSNGFKETKQYNKVYKITIILILTCVSLKMFMYMKSVNELENYISHNKSINESKYTVSKPEEVKEKFSKIKLDEIKKIYEIVGTDNITKISIDKNKMEMEGVCDNLDILDNLRKINYIKYYYIDSIIRDGEYYKFRIKS
ncbi:hypothetical protein [Clostridioides sp. ZZV15-6598]|uniref:hypothetical protein n=1 Tax=Clostridioides sp. ZZV15-6598 TaxID=2811501 RepID=UPI001D1243A7|nr:hypothetical protein [Clostridioides sp. ZZV15-6598]